MEKYVDKDHKTVIRSTLLNIDSSFRNLYPKNIYKSDGRLLPSDPLNMTVNSDIIKVYYPNHGLKMGDRIIMQNVNGISKIVSNSFYLLNKFKYMIIIFEDNMIETNYSNYVNNLYINIEIYGDKTIDNMINNIPLNSLLGTKTALIYNNIPSLDVKDIKLDDIINKYYPNYTTEILNKNLLFVQLPLEYINQKQNYLEIQQVFKISYLHIGGINIGYLNANYPINNYNYQSHHEVFNIINSDYFEIETNSVSYGTLTGGGNNVQVMKIINSITGFPNADTYVINLKKSFNNVINIELVSTEFPYIDLIVRKNINDKLYWKNLEDGPNEYYIIVDEGTYTTTTLLDKLKTKLNATLRITSTEVNKIYNVFDVEFETNTQTVKLTAYNESRQPNSFSIRTETINNFIYYLLTINHKNNLVSIGDKITISAATDTTIKIISDNVTQVYSIAASYINKEHTVYSVDVNNQTYDVILGLQDQVFKELVGVESRGGENITIKSKTKFALLFNKSDTIGDIIGFKNVGSEYAITDFQSIITNKDKYLNAVNLNSVGNEITYSSGFINLSGKYNYFLMYLNDIEFIYSNNNLPSAFAKILLSGNPGDILFNTFVKQPSDIYSKTFPISNLTELNVKFTYPDGTPLDFRNTNHSFTIRIIEEQVQGKAININSNTVTFIDELKVANLKD